MKPLNFLILAFFSLILHTNPTFSQSYGTFNLPEPEDMSPLFVGSLLSSNIYYGATPANSENKPVLVFVHGFIDLANLWFLPGNEIYDRAYDENYRTVFVALTRGGGMWQNGALLADMLEDITDHYDVDDVVIVAHSNGGKSSEVAMFHHDKYDLVDRVISLGTPFFGTEIADLAETFWFRWLVNFVGLGGGTATSTTYYMGGVARPYLDGQSDNQPDKFFNFGAWGWNSGTTIFVPTMLVTGALLNANGSGASAGGNDGITPYWSSTRPGGLAVWNPGFGNPVSQHDHIDMAMEYIVWDAIEPYFTGPLATLRHRKELVNPKAIVNSNVQYLSSENNRTELIIAEGTSAVSINILHLEEEADFYLETSEGTKQLLDVIPSNSMNTGYASSIHLPNLASGTYQLESNAQYAAVASFENGVRLQYTSDLDNEKFAYQEGETINMNVELLNTNGKYTDAKVSAIVTQKNDIHGSPLSVETVHVFEFSATTNNQFQYQINNLPAGIYNVVINASHEDFIRTAVTGFAIHPNETVSQTIERTALELFAFPNPIKTTTTIEFELLSEEAASLTIYDAYGRLMKQQDLSNLGLGKHMIDLKFEESKWSAGHYFIEVQNGQYKNILPVVKVK